MCDWFGDGKINAWYVLDAVYMQNAKFCCITYLFWDIIGYPFMKGETKSGISNLPEGSDSSELV